MPVNVSGNDLSKLFSKNFEKLVNIDLDYNINSVSAESLLCYNRIDVIAKYLYAKALNEYQHCDYYEQLYLAHIKAFNNFVEADDSGKVGPQSFVKSLKMLLNSLKDDGYKNSLPIPISRDGVPLDGAHRIGISIDLKQDIQTVQLDVESPIYDYRYFQLRGLKAEYLDHLALEYAKLRSITRMVVIWPTAEGCQNQLESILRKYGDIVYFKEVYLNKSGAQSFTAMAYKREHWVGTQKDGFAGAKNKASWCFEKSGPLRVFLFESTQDLIKMKDEIRDIFKVEKHSVHINDTHEETIELAQALFNANSVLLLNSMVHRQLNWFNRLFSHYTKWLGEQNLKRDDFCIDGSGTLAAFGIRDVRDLDFLYAGIDAPETGYKEIDCHNKEHQHQNLTPAQIVHDPEHYFYYHGQKFVSIQLIKELKKRRNEVKDQRDVAAIDAILKGDVVKEPLWSKLKKIVSFSYIKARIKLVLLKIRYHLTRLKYKS